MRRGAPHISPSTRNHPGHIQFTTSACRILTNDVETAYAVDRLCVPLWFPPLLYDFMLRSMQKEKAIAFSFCYWRTPFSRGFDVQCKQLQGRCDALPVRALMRV